MPLYKRRPFEANPVPPNLKDDEEVYYLKLTNEIFRDYDEYYARVILCNSMVWSCNLTGKANLTYQEALDSEKSARKQLKGPNFPKALKRAILYCSTLTSRSKLPDVVDDVLSYARDRYFKGEDVLAVIGNLWCPSRVVNIIEPTEEEIETYRQEQIEKGDAENNDYLKDDTWGPSPDLFRYEIEELDPDNPEIRTALVLDSIDVKREKAALTRDKVKFLLKLAMDFDEQKRKCVVKHGVLSAHGINKMKFMDIFVEKPPIFEESLAPLKAAPTKTQNSSSSKGSEKSKSKSSNSESTPKSSPKSKSRQGESKTTSPASSGKKSVGSNDSVKKVKKEKMERKPTPEELKQMEMERKAQEKERVKAQRKMMADFKKLWFKPKEDLEVEDLKDLPTPDPVSFKIPNNLFGEFMMVMEFMSSYSTFLKVRESFPSGLTLDALERALSKSEISGPFSDILQLLLRAVFRLQEGEKMEYAREEGGGKVGVELNGVTDNVGEAIQQATSAAAWSQMYQNTPLHKLGVDHSTVTEVLRLHLLSSGARHAAQSRGSCAENDDPGLYLRIDEPQILNKLSTGTVFDLTMSEKLRVIECLIHQILSYSAVKDIMEESYDLFRQARVNYRTLVAAEKRKEAEDHLWRLRLKVDRVIPDMNALQKAAAEIAVAHESGDEEGAAPSKSKKAKIVPPPSISTTNNNKPQLTDEQIEAAMLKKDKEIAKRKQDFLWQEADLLDQINKNEKKLGAHPLGRDRAFRRYWVFPTVPGLFVEHDDENLGPCLPIPTPFIGEVNLNDMNFISENYDKLKHVDKEGSDKENSSSTSPKKPSKKKSAPNTPVIKKEPGLPTIFGICTGDTELCPVHSQLIPRTRWSFFWEAEHIDALIAGLSPRGKREKELRQNLEEAKDTLKSLIKKCPVTKLNKDKKYPENVSAAPDRRPQRGGTSTKNQNDPNLGFPCGTPVTKIMELHLRDLILEFEEKIFLGGLGSLKVSDRNDWRTAIEGSSYLAGVEELNWGGNKTLKTEDDTPNQGTDDENSEKVVKKLACAILQVQQAMEHKFMKRPLVEREDEKKKKKSTESEATWKSVWNSTNTPVDRWQIALMKSTSFSQLFVHFYTLESSVEWSRSVLNARCRVCRRKGDPEKMLLCDTCNKGHHIYCLKPPMDTLPKGDWFCVDCRPDDPLPTPSKKRPLTDDDIIDELDSEDDDDDTEERGRKKRNEDDDDDDDSPPEVCNVCGYGGEVICCDSCPLVFHLLCLNPPKTRVPRGTWFCQECTNPKKKSRTTKNSRESKRSNRKRPVKRKLKYQETESDESESEEEEEEEEEQDQASDSDEQVVKVKFNRNKKKSSPDAPPATKTRRIMDSTDEEEEAQNEEEGGNSSDEDVGRGGKRRSASTAAAKIFQTAKRGRSDSKENETSESSNDSNYNNSRKRSYGDDDEEVADCPKRTRLQRMNTNNKVENGELDNVLLDKLISDVMKHTDSWPFLSPVTRTEAPDYHDIVKYPMDLGTIKYKLNSMVYTCNEEFVSDLLLVFTNCFLYNDSANHVHEVGMRLKQYCEKRCSKLGINFSDPVPS